MATDRSCHFNGSYSSSSASSPSASGKGSESGFSFLTVKLAFPSFSFLSVLCVFSGVLTSLLFFRFFDGSAPPASIHSFVKSGFVNADVS